MSTQVNYQEIQHIAIFYTDLGTKGKKVLDALHWWIKTFPLAYPCQAKIAKKAGCTRQWANAVIKKAAQAGIIQKLRRAYSTCRYFCAEWLKFCGFKKGINKFIEKVKSLNEELTIQLTKHFTIDCSNSKSKLQALQASQQAVSSKDEALEIPHYIKQLPVEDAVKHKLTLLGCSEGVVLEGYERLKKARGKGVVSSTVGYFINACIGIMRDKGVEPKWNEYYKD